MYFNYKNGEVIILVLKLLFKEYLVLIVIILVLKLLFKEYLVL